MKSTKTEELYKTLLVPATFLILISFFFLSNILPLIKEQPQLFPNIKSLPTDVLVPFKVLMLHGALLGISLFFYIWYKSTNSTKKMAYALGILLYLLFLISYEFIIPLLPIPDILLIIGLIIIPPTLSRHFTLKIYRLDNPKK